MSGEHQAFKPEDVPDFRKDSPIPFPMKPESPVAISEEVRRAIEQKKFSAAPTFDRLIEVTLSLVQSIKPLLPLVRRLVVFSYIIQITQLVLVSVLLWFALHR